MAIVKLELDEIQGNILAGFKNDYITYLFLELSRDVREARAWLADVIADVSTTPEVQTFNAYYSLARSSGFRDSDLPRSSWMNVALTHSGLQALGVDDLELGQLPKEFQDGMRKRAGQIGDTGKDAPPKWPKLLDSTDLASATIDALMIVADDDPANRNTRVADFLARASRRGATCVFHEDALRRKREWRAFEHFGYRDGVSQPAIVGYGDDPEPGHARVAAGEFVLGYPCEPAPGASVSDPQNPRPAWLKNGSFVVFRRLAQDVPGFNDFVSNAADEAKMEEVLFRAKVVGRYPSGAPLDAEQSDKDPGFDKDKENNSFLYRDADPDGDVVPRAAHIRKANPRDQQPPGDDDVRHRRMLRRGIPFGPEYKSDRGPAYSGSLDRGLCFVCYQRSIADQFEHIQRKWMRNDSHPHESDGIDPLSTRVWRRQRRYFVVPRANGSPFQLGKMWVTTTAGEYFFSPSITAMKKFAGLGQ